MAITPPDIDLENITLEDLTVVPDSSTSVQLEWKVVPTDGHNCIRNYNIQIAAQMDHSRKNKSLGVTSHFVLLHAIQLMHLQNYTCCVTANLYHIQIASKQLNCKVS